MKKWYVIHTYAGQENKVKANLERRLKSMNIENQIFRIVIPQQQIATLKGKEKKVFTKLYFSGYIFIEMNLTNESWEVVRNTPGVTGFVGKIAKPTPLSEEEVANILGQIEKQQTQVVHKIIFNKGDNVKIIQGPFVGFSGVVEEVDEERFKLKVMLTIFGRDTPVEISIEEVEAAF